MKSIGKKKKRKKQRKQKKAKGNTALKAKALDPGYQFAEKILAWYFRNLWVVPDFKQRRILRSAITYEIYSNRDDLQGIVAPQYGVIPEWDLDDERRDLPGFLECVEERIRIWGKYLINEDIEQFPDPVPEELIKIAIPKSERHLNRLFSEWGRLKSNSKQDVINYIAAKEIDPPKPGKKRNIKPL